MQGEVILCGVYRIRCEKTHKVYIGSSLDIRDRWRDHRVYLRIGRHHSVRLQSAWDEHGEDSFAFEVVEETTAADRIAREQHHMDETLCYRASRGYNTKRTAGDQSWHACKEYIITFPDGHEETIWNLNSFCRKHSLVASCMIRVAKGLYFQTRGFLCRYAGTSAAEHQLQADKRRRTHIVQQQYRVTNPDGEVFDPVANLQEFCRLNGLHAGMMYLGGVRGWQCQPLQKRRGMRARSKVSYIVENPDGTQERVNHLNEFARKNKLSAANLRSVASGRALQHKGYRCWLASMTKGEWQKMLAARRAKSP